jgi:4-azaleucine resistance transporter AzlC
MASCTLAIVQRPMFAHVKAIGCRTTRGMIASVSSPESDNLVRTALAIGAATGVYGLSFGALADQAGLSLGQVAAMSAFVFTGATQLSVAGVLVSGGAVPAALVNGWLVAARHLGYGITLVPVLRGARVRRALAAQLVIDESTAMAQAQPNRQRAERAFWLTGLSVFGWWNAASIVGALAGRALHDPAALGLDAVFPAAFVFLLAPQLRQLGGKAAALTGAAIAAVLVPIAPAGVPVLAAALAVLIRRPRVTR